MDDLISREDALERLRSIPADLGRRELDDAIKVIENMPSEGKAANSITIELSPEQIDKCVKNAIVDIIPFEQQWIPCSERLPNQNGKYLVVGRQKAINILKFDGGRWYGKWGVVAWMPMPDVYKGEEE